MAFLESSGNYVGGSLKKSSSLGSSKSSNQETWSFNNISTLIVELYLQTARGYSAFGLRSSNTEISSDTDYNKYGRCSWKEPDNSSYCFDNPSNTVLNQMYASYTMGDNPRRVFVFHNWQNGQMSIYPAHLSYGPKSTSSPFVSSAYIGTSDGLMNEWVTHTDGDGNIYKSITVNSNNQFIGTTLSVVKGKKYTFNMHTVSEASCDGIIISDTSMTDGGVEDSGVANCSGVNVKNSYTYYASSDGTIYIYFATDSSNLGNEYDTTDSNGDIISSYDGYTTGDIEIIVEPIKTQVTLNTNGSTNGTTSIEIPYGTDMSTISITPPTGKPYCTFAGYYTDSSRDLPGKKYIDSNGKGVNGLTWDMVSGSFTLYALYNYSRALVKPWYPLHCIYCTSSAVETSTLQTETSITLGEMSIISIEGTISCGYSILGGSHLSNDNITLIIPEGTASGDYKFSIKYEFTPNDTSVFIEEEDYECQIWITPTYIVDETMELPSPVPDSLVQWKDIPACGVTLDTNNLSEYFKINNTTNTPIPSTSTLIYNNGKTESSTPQITWSISNPITFNSLGTEIKSRQQVDIDNSNICMIVPKRFYDGNYYSNSKAVIEIVSRHVSSGVVVSYFSRFSDLGVNNSLNNYGLNNVNIIKDLEKGYSIKINRTALKDIYSVDLLCKFLHDLYHKGGISTNSGYSMLVSASYNSTQVYREANEVTNLHISVTDNPIYAGETTTWNTTADFTSGSKGVSVNGLETFSGYNTSIICIDNK